ncbi:hypothetical protein [Methylorubrum rhodesianum]|uniref:hypothetical protein n=1 Tax=Methylorubrum rhodesianum TaxID=29427 RepID=UPI003D2E4A1A
MAASIQAGADYDVTGRSMLALVLRPDACAATSAVERSFTHVMQAFERASAERVAFGPVHATAA